MAGILVRCPRRYTYSERLLAWRWPGISVCARVASPGIPQPWRLGQPVIVYSHLVGHMGIEQLILIQINPWILEGCPGLNSLPVGLLRPALSSSLFSKRENSQLALFGLSTVGEDGVQ